MDDDPHPRRRPPLDPSVHRFLVLLTMISHHSDHTRHSRSMSQHHQRTNVLGNLTNRVHDIFDRSVVQRRLPPQFLHLETAATQFLVGLHCAYSRRADQ